MSYFYSGPPGLKLDGGEQAVAMATGLRMGRYTFRLTVSDQQGATDSASLTVRVQEGETGLEGFFKSISNESIIE